MKPPAPRVYSSRVLVSHRLALLFRPSTAPGTHTKSDSRLTLHSLRQRVSRPAGGGGYAREVRASPAPELFHTSRVLFVFGPFEVVLAFWCLSRSRLLLNTCRAASSLTTSNRNLSAQHQTIPPESPSNSRHIQTNRPYIFVHSQRYERSKSSLIIIAYTKTTHSNQGHQITSRSYSKTNTRTHV